MQSTPHPQEDREARVANVSLRCWILEDALLFFGSEGYSVAEIKARFLEKDIFVGLVSICKLLIEEKWPCLKSIHRKQ